MMLPTNPLFFEIKDIDDQNITRQAGANVIPLTIGDAIRIALLGNIFIPNSQTDIDEEKKFELYQMSLRLKAAEPEGEIEFSTEELTLIKSRSKKRWPAEIYGPIHQYIEGNRK